MGFIDISNNYFFQISSLGPVCITVDNDMIIMISRLIREKQNSKQKFALIR